MDSKDRLIQILADALLLYADPKTYAGVEFTFTAPKGSFWDDFDTEESLPTELKALPGKRARAVLKEYDEFLQNSMKKRLERLRVHICEDSGVDCRPCYLCQEMDRIEKFLSNY